MGDNETVTDCLLTDNSNQGLLGQFGGAGNVFTSNDLSRSGAYGFQYSGYHDITLTGNTFTDCANGALISGIDGLSLSGLDLSAANIPNVAIYLSSVKNSTISNINASGAGGVGTGIHSRYGDNNQFSNITVTGRQTGINLYMGDNETVTDCLLTDNSNQGLLGQFGGAGNVFTSNDLSRSGAYGFQYSGYHDITLTGNTFTDCANGALISGIDGLNSSGLDLSAANIPNVAIYLSSVKNSTISNINASGVGGVGTDMYTPYTAITTRSPTSRSPGD